MKQSFLNFILICVSVVITACDAGSSDSSTTTSTVTTTSDRYLYVASGSCHSGTGNTTFSSTTASNIVYRLSLTTGAREVIADYWAAPSLAGDSPASIVNIDSTYMYVLVESATAANRRIDKVAKSPSGARTNFYNNAAAFTTVMRDMYVDSASNIIFSKSAAIELVTAAQTRPQNPYINPTAAPCTPAVTLISKVVPLVNGKVVFLHSNTAQNKIGIFAAAGGITCQTSTAPPNAASFPTAAFYDSTNLKLIVAYSGNATTTDLNSIYAYTVNETTGVLSSAQKIYDSANYPATQNFLLYGISEMTYDATNGHVYIATAISTATTMVNYAIEKFTYTPSLIGVTNTSVLTRVGTTPFYNYGNDTKCISKMMVAD